MFRPERLLHHLAPLRFKRTNDRRCSGDLCFSRVSNRPELFEQIQIGSQGKKGEVAYAVAIVSVVQRATGFDELMEKEFLRELASNPQRGWFEFKSRSDVVAWEERVAAVGPDRSAELANEKGRALLARTQGVRSLANEYVHHLRAVTSEKNADFLEYRLRSLATTDQRREASRLGDLESSPGDPYYSCGALTLMLFSEAVEGNHALYFRRSPSNDTEMLKLLTVLVDRVFLERA
jgi:hypothetical protein